MSSSSFNPNININSNVVNRHQYDNQMLDRGVDNQQTVQQARNVGAPSPVDGFDSTVSGGSSAPPSATSSADGTVLKTPPDVLLPDAPPRPEGVANFSDAVRVIDDVRSTDMAGNIALEALTASVNAMVTNLLKVNLIGPEEDGEVLDSSDGSAVVDDGDATSPFAEQHAALLAAYQGAIQELWETRRVQAADNAEEATTANTGRMSDIDTEIAALQDKGAAMNKDAKTRGAVGGAIIGGLLGMILGPVGALAGALIGGGLGGALAGKDREGLPKEIMDQIATLEKEKQALLADNENIQQDLGLTINEMYAEENVAVARAALDYELSPPSESDTVDTVDDVDDVEQTRIPPELAEQIIAAMQTDLTAVIDEVTSMAEGRGGRARVEALGPALIYNHVLDAIDQLEIPAEDGEVLILSELLSDEDKHDLALSVTRGVMGDLAASLGALELPADWGSTWKPTIDPETNRAVAGEIAEQPEGSIPVPVDDAVGTTSPDRVPGDRSPEAPTRPSPAPDVNVDAGPTVVGVSPGLPPPETAPADDAESGLRPPPTSATGGAMKATGSALASFANYLAAQDLSRLVAATERETSLDALARVAREQQRLAEARRASIQI